MKRITLMIFVSLLSFCTYGQLALEGFESPWTGTPAAPPGGWAVYNQVGNVTWAQSTAGFAQTPPYAGTHAAYLNRENVAPSSPIPTNWLITKQFNSPANGILHFYSRMTFPEDNGSIFKIKIAIVTDPGVPVQNLPWVDLVAPMGEYQMNPQQQQYVEKSFNVPSAYTGQQVRIAFIMEGDNGDRWLIDDVECISQCNPPSSLTVTNVTTTTASLSWNNPAGVTSWEIELVGDMDTPTGTGVVYSGTLPYNVTNLTENTKYKYYVRSLCSDGGKSMWVGPFFFVTPSTGSLCNNPLIIPSALPYTTTNNTTNFGDHYEGIPGTSCNATGNYLAGNDVVYSYTPTTSGSINITLSNTGGNAGVFVYNSCNSIGIFCIGGATASASAPGVIPTLALTANTTYYIVVSTNGVPQVTPYTLSLQQVSCAAPTTLAVSGQTATSANLSWTSTASSWQIFVQNPGMGLPLTAGQNVAQNTNLNVTSTTAGVAFTPSTQYEYYVRANCGNGTYSIWTGPFVFNTSQVPAPMDYFENFDGPVTHGYTFSNGTQTNKWVVGSATSNSVSNSLYVSNDNGTTNNYTLITPTANVVHAYRDIQIPAGSNQITVSFDFKGIGENNNDYVRVWLVPVSFIPTPGTQILPANGTQVGGNFQLTPDWTTQNIVVNSSTFTNSVRRLVFEWRNSTALGTSPAGAIDNVSVKTLTCAAPTALTSVSSTTSGTTVSWTAPTGTPPAGYDYFYSQNPAANPSPSTPEMGTSATTTATINPLNSSETYYIWIRSNCGTSKSYWVGPLTVIMPQVAATIPYNENFDGASNGFSFLNGSQPNKWVVGSAVSSSPSKSIYISNSDGWDNNYTNAASVTFAYRDVIIPNGVTDIDINFDVRSAGEVINNTSFNDILTVWMVPQNQVLTPGTALTASANVVEVGKVYNYASWTNLHLDLNVAAYQNTTKRLVFEWKNNTIAVFLPPAAIDNLNIKSISCLRPTNLTTTNVTNTNATLDWTEPGTATSWEVAYMPATLAATPTGSGIPVSGTSEYTPPAGTFAYGTRYVYYVRSVCGGVNGNSNWAGPFTFTLRPVNDECLNATVLTVNLDLNCTNVANGNIMGATQSVEANPTTCGGTKDDDVWYEFVATNTFHNIRLLNNSIPSTLLYFGVYTGTCGTLSEVKCSNTANLAVNGLVVGQTYKVRVWTFTNIGGQANTFQLCVTTPPPPPVNDNCTTAITLPVNSNMSCNTTVSATLYAATASAEGGTSCAGTEDDDVWFKFIATSTTHKISLSNIVGNQLVNHTVYAGNDCGTFTQVTCNTTAQSWQTGLTIGQTYYIRVYSAGGEPGITSTFDICITTPPPAPANDDCANATSLPVNPTLVCENSVNGTIESATASSEVNTCTNTNDDDDVWFEFIATNTSHVIQLTNVTGSDFNLYHSVYAGNICGTLTTVNCSDPDSSVLTNLTVGQTYKIRVWTVTATPGQNTTFQLCIGTPLPPQTNDECATAIAVPVNTDANCDLTTTGSIFGATASADPNSCGNTNDDDDIWFKFTATNTTHLISLNNIIGNTDLYYVLYSGECGALTQISCNDFNASTATNLTVGNEYKVRVYTNSALPNQVSQFEICIRIPNTPITVNPNIYTVEELVSEVLVNSDCAMVSNITSVSGSNFLDANSIGYFESNGATFPFQYGVVLSTGSAVLAQGPLVSDGGPGDNQNATGNTTAWTGDSDLEEIIVANDPLQTAPTYNATVLEFDFVPLTNKFKFDFLLASAEYGSQQCFYTDAFAFILTDENGNSQNLAVIPNTNIPVSVTTIRDGQYNALCGSNNVEYFGQFNLNQPLASAINYYGQTKPMVAEGDVVPGANYHIKMVIADYKDSKFDAAIFLGGGSFDLGELELGGDMTIAGGNALCEYETTILDTELVGDQYNFTWYKNGTIIPDAISSTYEVTETGNYGVGVTIDNASCSFEGVVTIEYYPSVTAMLGEPSDLTQCDASGFYTFDLTPNIDAVNAGLADPQNYTTTIHLTEADAHSGSNPVDSALYTAYTNTVINLQTLWTRTVNSITGCYGIKSFDLVVQSNVPQYTINNDFAICDGTSATIDVVLTDNDSEPVTYAWTKDGIALADTTPTITVTEAGAYTVVLTRGICTATSTVNITVNTLPVADAPDDVTACGQYVLPGLNPGNSYNTATGGSGNLIPAGTAITTTQDIYVLAQSGTTPNCTAENVFTVTINPLPVITSPGNQTACDSYVLPALATGNYFTGQGGTGNMLNADDVITTSQTIFIYAETGTIPNCTAETSFDITISPSPTADAPEDVNACDGYLLPALTAGNTYWTGTNGTGEQLPEGYVVEQSMDIFVFAQTATNPVCTDESSFSVNIHPTPAFTLGGPYTACLPSNVTITVAADNFNEAEATYTWTLDGAAIAGTGKSITASGFGIYEVTVTVNNCSHSESVEVIHENTEIPLIITDGCENGVYMVGVSDENGSFDPDTATYSWTGPGNFTSDKQEFAANAQGEYFVTVTTPEGCIGEDSIVVSGTSCDIQKGISPNNDGYNDYFDLSELMVKHLSIFNRYGQEVYSKDNYKNEWAGQTDNGKELPTGTYFYMIEIVNGESKTGWIYINRQD